MNQTTGKLTRSAHTAAAGEPFPSLANKSPFRADMLSHRIEEIIHDDLMPAPASSFVSHPQSISSTLP
jgi:hypothetical protein